MESTATTSSHHPFPQPSSSVIRRDSMSLYKPLVRDVSEIRLLTIQPSANKNAPIMSIFHQAWLEDEPTYTTLSYVWGDKSAQEDIYVNGTAFSVTKILASA